MKSSIQKLISLPRLYLSKLPIYLILFVTSRCNAQCKMCFNWRSQKEQKEELSLTEIRRISSNFSKLLQVTLSGGEPFLRDDIPAIIETFYKNNHTQFFTIPTNAFFPEKIESNVREILKTCPDIILNLGLSLDGISNLHDEIRSLPGSFGRLLETYMRLAELKKKYPNFSIEVTTVVSSFNSNSIKELAMFVADCLDVDAHRLVLARADTRFRQAKEVLPLRYKELAQHLIKNTKKKWSRKRPVFVQLFNILYQQVNKLVFKTVQKRQMFLPCLAGRRLIEIYEDGTVRPCEILHTLTEDVDSVLGNLKDFNYDIKEILKTEKTRNILNYIRNKKCFCTFECAIVTNIIFNPRSYLSLIRNIFN